MSRQEKLAWEARWARPAAAAAFGAVLVQIASVATQISALQDAPGRDEPLRVQANLLNFKENSAALLASSLLQTLATALTAGALFYLFRATRARRSELPAIIRWLVIVAPILLLVAAVLNWTSYRAAADDFTTPAVASKVRATPTKEQRDEAAKACKRQRNAPPGCVAQRARREAVADKLIKDRQNVVAATAYFAGGLALAFAFVVTSLNAMRAGLFSRFIGILGIIVGVLLVLPLLPGGGSVVQIFWLGALGVLFLNRWPGGRGPAWETDEPVPWPTAQDRIAAREGAVAEPEPEPDPENGAGAPAKRKRKKKKR